ncbi:MAG: hypothetical protein HY286_07830 [Planctomycetes bacterium]|nr:hypothetical protein [Planctomycetota bacterium]
MIDVVIKVVFGISGQSGPVTIGNEDFSNHPTNTKDKPETIQTHAAIVMQRPSKLGNLMKIHDFKTTAVDLTDASFRNALVDAITTKSLATTWDAATDFSFAGHTVSGDRWFPAGAGALAATSYAFRIIQKTPTGDAEYFSTHSVASAGAQPVFSTLIMRGYFVVQTV